MSTTTDLTTLKINYLTQAQYDAAKSGGTINENEIYMTPTGSLIDLFYPVGSYYETSDTTFNPNTAWGGTWVKDSAGKVTVAQDANDSDFSSIGNTGGEKTHTLATSEIPAHTHGSKTLTASFSGRRQGNDYASHWAGTNTTVAQGSGTATSDAAGTTSKHQDVISFSMTHTHDSVGDGEAHENMPPYVVVNRWHRTA